MQEKNDSLVGLLQNQPRPKKILIVEDDPDMREALKIALEDAAFKTLEAKNGHQGLEIALADHPNLIILDIIMPRMDGLTMLKKLRSDMWGKNVPVIILTNVNENDKLAEALEIGVDEYLLKTDVKPRDIVKKTMAITGIL